MGIFAKLTVVFLIMLNSLCVQPDVKRGMEMETAESFGKVILSGEIEKTDDSLMINYQLTNQSQEKIYIWDLIPVRDEGGEEVEHDLAYRCFEEPDTLRVVRAVLPLPLDREVYMKNVPYVRPVEPNKSVTGKIVLPLPILEYNPYYPLMDIEDQKEIEVNKIRLIIGWTEVRSGMIVTETEAGGETVQMIRGAWESPLYHLVDKTFQSDVKIKFRTDEFDRRMPEH